jgi:Holliday junction resolvase RusA-like endonuclease
MQSFIITRQPKAYQGGKTFKSNASRIKYSTDLESCLRKYNPNEKGFDPEVDLYGLVIYFFKFSTGTDADNISKPIWDCLKGKIFNDDKQVKLRTAGIFDLSKHDYNILDLSGLKGELIVDLLEAIDSMDHVVYIECGILNLNMYQFNLEKHGN